MFILKNGWKNLFQFLIKRKLYIKIMYLVCTIVQLIYNQVIISPTFIIMNIAVAAHTIYQLLKTTNAYYALEGK